MKPHKTINTEKIFSGVIFDLVRRIVKLPNEKEAVRDVILHNGAAVIIPITKEGKVVMVRQYRVGSDKIMLELPAGKLDLSESPQNCAKRELKEETGYYANSLQLLFETYPVAAYCTEKIGVFLAEDLEKGETNPDADEFVEVELHELSDLLKMIDSNEIDDMKTIMGILYYARKII